MTGFYDMTPEEIVEMRDSVRRIETGLFGDDGVEQQGLFKRVKDHGRRIGRIERVLFYLTGAALTVIGVYHVLIDMASAAAGLHR